MRLRKRRVRDSHLQDFRIDGRRVVVFDATIETLHRAAEQGRLEFVHSLMSRAKGRIELSRDPVHGRGILHRVIIQNQRSIIEYLLKNYPSTLEMRDKALRTPLHYVGVCDNRQDIWKVLIKAGANSRALDSFGKTPVYYMNQQRQFGIPKSISNPDIKSKYKSV